MGFGPNGYNGKTFAEMSEAEKQAFASRCESILEDLSHYKDEKLLTESLERAITNGLLYHADGRPVAVNEIGAELTRVRNGYEDNIGSNTFLSDFVLVRYNQNKPEKQEFSYHPIIAQFSSTIEADTTPFTAEELAQKYEDNADEIEIQKKIAAERRPVDFSVLGPKEYDGVSFGDMSEKKEQEYKAGVAGVLGKLANRYDIDSAELQEVLVDATKYGMLIYPDGKEVSRQEVEATLQKVRQEPDPNKKSDILGEFTVLEYDPTEGELGFLPLSFQGTSVLVRSGTGNYLDEARLNERKNRYEEKVIRQREKAAKEAAKSAAAAQAPAAEPVVPAAETQAPAEEIKAPAEEVKAPAEEVKAPVENKAQPITFGPTGYHGIKFSNMNPEQWQSYEADRDNFLSRFSKGVRSSEDLKGLLIEACEYGMLYRANGQAVNEAEVEQMAKKPETMVDLATDFILVNCDPSGESKNIYNPIMVMGGYVLVDEYHRLTDRELTERKQALEANAEKGQQEVIRKEQEAARKAKEAAIEENMRGFDADIATQVNYLQKWENSREERDNAKFDRFFDDLNMVGGDLGVNSAAAGSEYLTTRIQIAIDRKLVHFSDGTVPKKEDAERISRTPMFLKDLVFTSFSDGTYETQHTYHKLTLSNDEPPKVKMDHMNPLTPENIFEMTKTRSTLHPKEELPGLLAQALKVTAIGEDNGIHYEYEKIDDKAYVYAEEMKGLGMDVERIEGMDAFRVKPGNELYVYGRSTPITSLEDFAKETEGIEPPKEPNSWGFFEGIRKAWHGIFHNVADYVEYDNKMKEYEVAKYKIGLKAGFDVSDKADTVAQYENELIGYRDEIASKQVQVKSGSQEEIERDVARAMENVGKCLKENQPSDFYKNIKAVISENTEFASIMRKGLARMSHDDYNGYSRAHELNNAKALYEKDMDANYLKAYGKYAAVYMCSNYNVFSGNIFKNKNLNFPDEVNLLVKNVCDTAAKMTKANPNLSPNKLQTKIDAEAQKRVDTFKDLAKEAIKEGRESFEEDLDVAGRAADAELNIGKVTDVAKAQAGTQKIMEGEAKKMVENGEVVIQNNSAALQNNAPAVQEGSAELQGEVNENANNEMQMGTGI